MSTLYLMLGYPGAGKTTTARYLQQLTEATHLNSDDIRLELFPEPTFTQDEHDKLYAEIDRRTADLLKQGTSVIYDANLNRKVHRQEKYDLCDELGAKHQLLWVQTPKPIAKQRRIEEITHHQFVPRDESAATMFDRLVEVFEAPADNEPFVAIDGQTVSPDSLRTALSL